MSSPFHLDELASKLLSILPDNFRDLDKEIKQQFKNILQTSFSHLDLVTREEFDVQTKVLTRTREKLILLEKQVEAIQKSKKPTKD